MTAVFRHHRWLAGLALLTMLLRVAVPGGYMPTSIAGGWYLSLCPHGMPNPAAVAALANSAQHEHHHGHGAQGGHDHGAAHSFDHCELGSGLTLSATLEAFGLSFTLIPVPAAQAAQRTVAPQCSLSRIYHSRAPPHTALS